MRAEPGGPGWALTIALVASIALCVVLVTRVRVGSPPMVEIAGGIEPCSSEQLDDMRTRYLQLLLAEPILSNDRDQVLLEEERNWDRLRIEHAFERCGEALPTLTDDDEEMAADMEEPGNSMIECLPANQAVARYWIAKLASDDSEQVAHWTSAIEGCKVDGQVVRK